MQPAEREVVKEEVCEDNVYHTGVLVKGSLWKFDGTCTGSNVTCIADENFKNKLASGSRYFVLNKNGNQICPNFNKVECNSDARSFLQCFNCSMSFQIQHGTTNPRDTGIASFTCLAENGGCETKY